MATKKFLRTILAAVADTEASGQVAARKAVELAWLFDADVVLYHACYDSGLDGGVFFDTTRLAKVRREVVARTTARLESLAASIAEAGVEVRCEVAWQRRVAEAVAQAATRARADLVVAEPRYRGTGRRRGLSHTDWELARLSPVPVLMCRSAAPYSNPHVVAAVDPGGHGLRPSSLDVRIVNFAAAVASAAEGSVRIVHCVREPLITIAARPGSLRSETQRVRSVLSHLARGAGLNSRAVRLVQGEPGVALLDAVETGDADLLVMGAVVRSRIGEWLVGSTAERLLHEAPCDILLIKPSSSRRR